MPIVINQNVSQVAAQVATPAAVVLQPGSVISARVLQVVSNNTVQIAIGGQVIEAQSQVSLQAGQTLQLAVSQTSDGIRLAIVDPHAATAASQGPSVSSNGAVTSDSVTPRRRAIACNAPSTSSSANTVVRLIRTSL